MHTLRKGQEMLKCVGAEENRKGAFLNALYNNKEFKHYYTPKQQARAETVKDLMLCAYSGTVYINYRKQFISIKLARGAFRRDKRIAQQFEQFIAENRYTQVETAQGTIVRIAR